MADRLFLSCWLRQGANGHTLNREKLLRQFAKMLALFPLSRLAARGPDLRVYAIERTEPPQFEREFPHAEDPAETVDDVLAAAGEFMQDDCLCEVDAAWDLWQFDGKWRLAPAMVTFACFAPEFDNEIGDHLRIEFGLDSHFIPDPDIEGSVRMSASNLKSLVHLVREVEGTLELERRHLWSESGENPANLIAQALESSVTSQGERPARNRIIDIGNRGRE
jgi:hypothetical protein